MSAKIKNRNYYALTILFAGALVFVLVFVIRLNLGPKLTPLERIILDGAPEDHVHAVAQTGDTTFVGTHLGLLSRTGAGNWNRVSGAEGDLLAVRPAAGGALLISSADQGLFYWRDGDKRTLLPGNVRTAAAHGDLLVAYEAEAGLIGSQDGGANWSALGEMPEAPLTLAIDPQTPSRILAGGLDHLFISEDGGQTWRRIGMLGVTGSITDLQFDPTSPQRLWAAAGGSIYYTESLSSQWRRAKTKETDRIATAIAFGGDAGPLAVTPDGYLFRVSP